MNRNKSLGGLKSSAVLLVAILSSACTTVPDSEPLQGHYTWGHEVRSFRPCGSAQVFWLTGEPAMLKSLNERASTLASSRGKAYQALYIEGLAVEQKEPADGFAAKYDGVYRLLKLQLVSEQAPIGCQPKG